MLDCEPSVRGAMIRDGRHTAADRTVADRRSGKARLGFMERLAALLKSKPTFASFAAFSNVPG